MEKPEVFISEKALQKRIEELGKQITLDYQNTEAPPILLCILKGSILFYADLIRQIDINLHCEFMGISTYGDQTQSTGSANITHGLKIPLQDRDILIVEDIIDSGFTLHYLLEHLHAQHPKSIKVCSLLLKDTRAANLPTFDYVGFTVPNHFMLGYGLDYAGLYRNLPYLGILNERPEKQT